MTCLGCDSTGYRKLCNYDDEHNTCGGGDHPILGQSSYKCVGKGFGSNQNQCVHVNQAPGPGRFTTMQECQQNCSTPGPPLQSKSYKCVGTGYGGNNRQCVQMNAPPGPGRYPSIQQCQQNCSTPGPPLQSKSYKCVGTGYGGNNRQCVQMNAPPGPGRYPSIQQCQSHCGGGGNVGSSYRSSSDYIANSNGLGGGVY